MVERLTKIELLLSMSTTNRTARSLSSFWRLERVVWVLTWLRLILWFFMIAIGMLTDDPPTIYFLIHFSSGILKLICRLWIVHIVSAKPNRFTCSGSLLRAVSKSVCWSVLLRNFVSTSSSFSKDALRLRKVCPYQLFRLTRWLIQWTYSCEQGWAVGNDHPWRWEYCQLGWWVSRAPILVRPLLTNIL